MAKKKAPVIEGAPDWIVTFADLMSLLVCFFVLLISFSIQDDKKLQVVAGSMRDAFGIREQINKAGMIEREGSPARDYVKNISLLDSENDTDFSNIRHNKKTKQGSEANTHDIKENNVETPRQFALAAASLRQAWQSMPDISEISENLILEDTPEGLNGMVYNRCVGTRYCANNCTYKVRRFNWFDYAHDDKLENLVLNPDVTVRSRGVMEKCTYCIQRINAARYETKLQDLIGVPDGFFKVACEQACPSDAITFGNILDEASDARAMRDNHRSYLLLGFLATRPRTTHMLRVRNRSEERRVGKECRSRWSPYH